MSKEIEEKNDIDKKLRDLYSCVMTIKPQNYKVSSHKHNYRKVSKPNLHEYKMKDSLKGYIFVSEQIIELQKNLKELKQQINKEEEIKKINNKIRDLVNPNEMYNRLGVDVISIFVGKKALPIADPEQNGQLIPKIAALRYMLTDHLGYVIPNVRAVNSTKLNDYEYQINIRGKKVFRGILTEEDIKNNDPSKIIENLYSICIKYAKQIISKLDILKLMELVKSYDPTLVNDLVPCFLTSLDLKKIFVNLIQDGVSIRDIIYIFEILNDYARFTQDLDELAKIIKRELSFDKVK